MVLVQIPVQACLDKVLWIGLMWTMILIANNVYYSFGSHYQDAFFVLPFRLDFGVLS
jgi:hypothetical protein